MQDFSVEGDHKMFGGPDFSRGERNFTIGQSPKIWRNFSKICIKINKKLKEERENSRKNAIFSRKFLIMGKIKNLIRICYNGGLGGRSP